MNVYVDQNFLIYCVNQPALRTSATEAVQLGRVSFVLSPWHFYEIGTIAVERQTELLAVVSDLKPSWILERYDLELGEFRQEWGRFWGSPYEPFVPIGTLPYVASHLLRATPERLEGAGLEHYVDAFSRLGTANINPVLDEQRGIAAANQASYRDGRLTKSVRVGIERSYLAQQLANDRMRVSTHEEHQQQLQAILVDRLLIQKINFFRENDGMRNLRAYAVETILTDMHHAGEAHLTANRQIDRQHTIPALAYCNRFVTDDRELLKRCAAVSRLCGFGVAAAQNAADFSASVLDD